MLFGLGELLENLFGIGEATYLMLGKEQFAVGDDIELAPPSFFQGRNKAALFLKLSCETRSLGTIVSHNAVFDDDLHESLHG